MNGWDKKRDVMRRYDAAAHIYDHRYEREQTAKYNAALKGLEKKEFGLVLDLGCGTGLLFSHIADRAQAIVGLDVSKKTLLRAKRRARAPPNTHLVCADADSTPLKEHLFNHVFAMTLIQNSPNPVQTLNEVRRTSKDDAVIAVTGLKRVFPKKRFEDILRKARMQITILKDEEGLECYVAICTKMQR
jgi:ubiquinone/menaquinone biosynthesis C-methylase UbiE